MVDGPHFELSSAGETIEVISESEAEASEDQEYRFEAVAGRWRLAHSKAEARRGDILRPTQSATVDPNGRAIYAHLERMPQTGDGNLLVRQKAFSFDLDGPSTLFSATDRADDNRDLPVATEESDGFSAQIDYGLVDQGATVASKEYFLEPPDRATEITAHVQARNSMPDGAEIHVFLRLNLGASGMCHIGSYPEEWSDAPEYLDDPAYQFTKSNTEFTTFTTTDVPSTRRLAIEIFCVDTTNGMTTDHQADVTAMVR